MSTLADDPEYRHGESDRKLPGGLNIEKANKAVSAGISAGTLAFVPLAAGASKLAVGLDFAIAIAVGFGTAVFTYIAPANKTADKESSIGE